MPEIKFEPSVHRNKKVIFIFFEKDASLIARVKKLQGVKWSMSKRAWYVTDNKYYREKFKIDSKNSESEIIKKIHPLNQSAFRTYVEALQLRGLSQNTIKTYRIEFAQLLYKLKDYEVSKCDSEMIRRYFLYCLNELKLSEGSMHSRINAIKFYFEKVLHREKFFFDIPRPKKQIQNPKLFSKEEIEMILKSIENRKHKTMILLAYSGGLRVSELIGLEVRDIDSRRMVINIRQAKGKKDRIVPLSPTTLKYLREYAKEYQPKNKLFEGQYEGSMYSARSVQSILEQAKKRAKVDRKGSIHSLRHSYATHLLDKGVDITYIQKILGHNDLKTTLRYLHVTTRDLSKIESPLEDLNF